MYLIERVCLYVFKCEGLSTMDLVESLSVMYIIERVCL